MPEFSRLLQRARAGDRAAASELFDAYRAQVERAAHRGLGSRLQARFDTADIAQSVFTDMLRELPTFEDRGERSFRAWLAAKVRHKLASKARRQVRSDGLTREERLATALGLGTPDAADGPDAAAAFREDRDRLTALLGTLEPAQNAVIGLFLDEGLSWDEVARRLDLPSAAAARMRYVRALAMLRDRWTRG
jgi:RNA polymerase sigma-70 factor, ECF subfamily